ncbi:MAG: hypothetical protein V3T88_06230 [Nitrosomonadaceae bacterium]
MVKKLFGGSTQQSATPTGFGSLPGFAQEAFQQAVERGQTLSQQEGAFGPAALQPQQLQAIEQLGVAPDPLTQERFQEQLGIFFNPFEEQALQGTIGDIERTGRGLLSDIGIGATEAGGFGGTRQAALESGQIRDIADIVGQISAQSRGRAFETAADRALGQIGREQELGRQSTFDLLTGGGILQQQQQQQQQAPINAINFLASLAQGIPTGGGTVSRGETDRGIIPGLFGS